MASWRVGGKLKRTLYRDEQLVGLVDTAEIAREIVHRMNLIIPIVVPDGLESGRERSLFDLGTGEPVGTSPCRCQLCQSEVRYESRCGVCDALVHVVRGRFEEHGEEGARCPGSGEDAR